MRPLVEEWRKLAAIGDDNDDGMDVTAFLAHVAPLIEDLPVFEYVTAEGPFESEDNIRF